MRPQTKLQEQRDNKGYSQEGFAAALQVAPSTVWRWETGRSRPQKRQRDQIRDLLELKSDAELQALLQDAASANLAMSRASLAAAGSGHGDLDPAWCHLTEWWTSTVSEEQVAFLEDQVERVVAEYEHRGPHELGPVVGRLFEHVQHLLQGLQRLRIQARLYRVGCRAAGLLGYMAINAGQFDNAATYCDKALQLAVELEDVDLQLWVWGTYSLSAYYRGEYLLAHFYAAHGRALAPNSPQAIRLAVNGEARALGQLGDRAGAEAAVAHATSLLERYEINPALTPCLSFEPYGYARVAANAATAYVPLGDTPRVLHYTGEVTTAVEQADSDWSRALTRLDVATSLLSQQQPDLDHALALAHTAMQVCADHPIRSVWQRASTVAQLARRWPADRRVREFTDTVHQWQQRPAVHAVAK